MQKPGFIEKLTEPILNQHLKIILNNTFNEILKTIFQNALELNKSEREKYFNGLNDEQKKYLDEVKSLLESYESTDDFLEVASNYIQIFTPNLDEPHPLIGKHIGPYLIEDEVGYGGMGIVFIGKRDDKEFEQKVAVKILKQGLSTKYTVKRFENERQILANLQHPNIARLFDGGKTSDGLPYLIMEYIEGIPITEYCSEKNLSIKERLKLFKSVCSAVQYAHQNLIVHRDLKPGNILVNKQRRPKLLDFGIAKLVNESIVLENSQLTQTKMWNLTPEYASPEQIKGENITTASDIYSLGVLLYQLISGKQPYTFANSTPHAINKTLDETDIVKPSELVKRIINQSSETNKSPNESQKMIKQLKGDLDNIILKAMHKDPNQRYFSVQSLINDIDRYFKGMPVKARRDTFSYRFTKFVQRHKVGVTSFVFFTIIMISSIIAIIYQGRIAAKERDKAKIENQKYEKVNDFLTKILSSVDPAEIGRDVKVYDVLEKAAKDVDTELKNQPEVEASIRSTLGNTYVNLGEYDKGKPFLDKAYEINLKLYGEKSKETATSIHDLALYYDWIGEYKIADSLYSKSISIFKEVLEKPTKVFADALNNYAIVLMNFYKYEEAEKLYLEAIEISKKVEGEKSRNLAVMYNNLAYNYTGKDNLDTAEKYYKKSLAIILEVLGKNRPEVGSAYNNIGWLFTQKGEYDSAEVYLQKSYQLKYELKGKDHPDVGLALNNLGVIEVDRGNYKKAEKYFLDAVKQYRKTYSAEHPYVALSKFWLGRIYNRTGRYAEAEKYLREALRVRIKKLPEDSWEIRQSKGVLGIALVKEDKLDEAEKLLLESYRYYIENLPNDKKTIKNFLTALIELYNKKNSPEITEKYNALLNGLK